MVSDKLKERAALLLGVGEPVGTVSEELGVSRQSLYNWRHEKDFQELENQISKCLQEFKSFVTKEVCFGHDN